ncbi:hypothetical protein Pstr01_36860 [Pseudomonas straminea]|uniref:Alpha/beta hydrolase n=1 Tax=Pseudomonas straminea TaxID=47882 RepID=A0A1I1XQI6_PSEOC|nr:MULTISPECIES: hypothetical protein [Pseudomonas]TWE05254.1 hypothetical protein FB481_1071 [Pseudomonas sp. AG1028]GLX15447.1 hypothetical protein Pstr01_36860 [Pseudomonas straminea]SFE08013.1 hypothetical protein SAMN05216372_10885 [Pseudomonas straminea]
MNTTQSDRWQVEVERRLSQGVELEFTQAQFARTVEAAPDDVGLKIFLDGLVGATSAERHEVYRCPMAPCARLLPAGMANTVCPFCQADFEQEGVTAEVEPVYRLVGEGSRDIRWLIVIHGMNSRAKWQEAFSWEIANRLSYSAPVLIYKYGWATIDVFARWLHDRLARRLGERMRIAIAEAQKSRLPDRPDIIAHSFGTLLLSRVLENPEFADLKFGRIITAASIVRPDFDWDRLIAQGRVEAVLNHVGGQDRAVPFAQYAIPGAGPGGKVGYLAASTLNVRAEEYGHSGFFLPENLGAAISRHGLWQAFLTRPLARFRPVGAFVAEADWRPAPLVVRMCTRTLAYGVFWVLAPFSWVRRKIDP